MIANTFIDNAKVMPGGQMTISQDILEIFGISCGDRITFAVEKGSVRHINFAVYAMQRLRLQTEGEAVNAGPAADKAVMGFCSNYLLVYVQNIEEIQTAKPCISLSKEGKWLYCFSTLTELGKSLRFEAKKTLKNGQ